MKINKYIKEIKYLKSYVLTIAFIIILCYTLCLLLERDTVINLGSEDHFVEWLTAITLIIGSILFLLTFIKTKNIFLLLLSLLLLIGFGEEIAWGQRIFDFKTPKMLNEINVQHEFTIHNIEIFNSIDFNGHNKHGFARLEVISFMSRVFFVLFAFILPFVAYHIKIVSSITMKIKLPIPPISIGIFFVFNWIIIHLFFMLSDGSANSYYAAVGEVSECMESIILLFTSLYFFNKWKIIILGKDIKEII